MSTLKELLAQRAALEAEIAKTKARERGDAISKVKALMAEYGLSVADLGPKPAKATKLPKVAAKFVNQKTGEAWSGRGLQPRWLKAELANGSTLADFAV